MSAYAKSMLRLKKRGLLTEAMIDKAVTLGRISAEEAELIKAQ